MKQVFALCSILALLALGIATSAQADATATPPQPILPTQTPAPLELNPLLGIGIAPPFEMTLPEGWALVLRDTYTYRDILGDDRDGPLESLPIDVYAGPMSNGDVGWIVIVWGYDSIVPFDPAMTDEEFALRAAWLNGLRMLQFVVFDARCNIGTAPQRDYSVGGLPAIGATFSAVDCPFEQPDTRGWFAALNVDGLNFALYAYVDPIQPAGSLAEIELQAIIDTLVFDVEAITVTAAEFQATNQALALTPSPVFVTTTPEPTTSP